MSFSEFDVTRRTRKGNFLNQIDYLIDWKPIEKAIAEHYAPTSDAAGLSLIHISMPCAGASAMRPGRSRSE